MKVSKPGWICFFAALAAALGLRIYFLMTREAGGPLFLTEGGLLSILALIVLAAGAVLCFVLFRGGKGEVWQPQKSVLQMAASLLCGVAILVQSIYAVMQAPNAEHFILLGTGALAGLALVLHGCACGAGQNFYEKHAFLALLPCLWCGAAMLAQFTKNIGEVLLQENLLLTVALGLFLLFFFQLAQILTGAGHPSASGVYRFGLAGALFGFANSVPELLALLLGRAPESISIPGMHGMLLPLSLFAVVTLAALRTQPQAERGDREDAESLLLRFLQSEYRSEPHFYQKDGNP